MVRISFSAYRATPFFPSLPPNQCLSFFFFLAFLPDEFFPPPFSRHHSRIPFCFVAVDWFFPSSLRYGISLTSLPSLCRVEPRFGLLACSRFFPKGLLRLLSRLINFRTLLLSGLRKRPSLLSALQEPSFDFSTFCTFFFRYPALAYFSPPRIPPSYSLPISVVTSIEFFFFFSVEGPDSPTQLPVIWIATLSRSFQDPSMNFFPLELQLFWNFSQHGTTIM